MQQQQFSGDMSPLVQYNIIEFQVFWVDTDTTVYLNTSRKRYLNIIEVNSVNRQTLDDIHITTMQRARYDNNKFLPAN